MQEYDNKVTKNSLEVLLVCGGININRIKVIIVAICHFLGSSTRPRRRMVILCTRYLNFFITHFKVMQVSQTWFGEVEECIIYS